MRPGPVGSSTLDDDEVDHGHESQREQQQRRREAEDAQRQHPEQQADDRAEAGEDQTEVECATCLRCHERGCARPVRLTHGTPATDPRGHTGPMSRWRTISPYLLAAVLAGAGALHLFRPEVFDPLIPSFLPNPRAWTYVSGVAELACAVAVAVPRTRRRGGLASAALLVAVFPGNLWMVVEPGEVPRWVAVARLPLQVPLVLWALQVGGKFLSTGSSAARRG